MVMTTKPEFSESEIRQTVLEYFHGRYRNAKGLGAGKNGAAGKIREIRRDLKLDFGLSQQQVQRGMTYLLSQGWIEEERIVKQVSLPKGTVIPQVTPQYKITAAGIDKIEGPGDFTPERFQGVNFSLINRSIVTTGDGNRIDATYEEAGNALVDLRNRVLALETVSEEKKIDVIADIDTIEAQLVKTEPNAGIINAAWENIRGIAQVLGFGANIGSVAAYLAPFLTN